MTTLGIFVKQPLPGFAKTRLAATLGEEGAANLAAAFIGDTVIRFRTVSDERVLAVTPATADALTYFRGLGRGDYVIWEQPGGSFGERLSAFFVDHLEDSDGVVVIGADTPTLPREVLTEAFLNLKARDCVLGPAADGGIYLMGLRRIGLHLFENVEWGTSRVLDQFVENLSRASLTLSVLPPWHDIDTIEDLEMLRGQLRALEMAGNTYEALLTSQALRETDRRNPG